VRVCVCFVGTCSFRFLQQNRPLRMPQSLASPMLVLEKEAVNAYLSTTPSPVASMDGSLSVGGNRE